jgi:hypothetical protein
MSTIIEESSADPIRPPGLQPLQGDRLWKPHEDGYWTNLREQWGSATDLNEADDEAHNPDMQHIRHLEDHSQGSHGSEDDMNDGVDFLTADGTVFRIVLAHGLQHVQERDSGGSPAVHRTTTLDGQPNPRHINRTPLTDAVSLHFPP